ncbi:MAG: sugar phosphate isomerase/epimerase family protein [Planctomycetota bacterium]
MLGFRIAAQTSCLAQSIKKALHTAAEVGCNGVQIDGRTELPPAELSETGLRQFRKILADLNLRVGSVAFPTRRGYADPADLQPRLEATEAAMHFASRLGSGVLVGNLGPMPHSEDTSALATLHGALERLASVGNRLGVRFVAQSAAPALLLDELIRQLPEGTLWLDLHPASLISRGDSPSEFVDVAGRHIAHVHAADAVYDLSTSKGVEVELGRGTADFPELLGMLEEHGYRDWLTIERRQSRQPIEDFRNAVSYLRSL